MQGQVSAYFTVFAPPYLPIHTTKIEKADEVYARNIGTHLLKVTIKSCPQAFPTEFRQWGKGSDKSFPVVYIQGLETGAFTTLTHHSHG